MLSIASQKSEYTFKYNRTLGRHGWLRLTPAYGVKLVEKLLHSVEKDAVILDPFSGTATTGLVAAEHGNQAFALDINPFLVWLGNVKCQNYPKEYLNSIRDCVEKSLREYKEILEEDNWIPKIFNIERWWSSCTLRLLSALRTTLVKYFGEPQESSNNAVVWIAFCRLIIETSSAAFNHVSKSFTVSVNDFESEYIEKLFLTILNFILESAETTIQGSAKIIIPLLSLSEFKK